MNFELWSVWHILYILSPFAIFCGIYFLVHKQPEQIKNRVGLVLGILSVLVIIIRNIDIYVRSGWGVEVIPLQVCHIGSIVAGLALIFRKKWLLATSFCFHLIPAVLATVFADALVNYDTLLKIRPQTYVWGHILIVVCALYGVFVFRPQLAKRDLIHSLSFIGVMSLVAILCNSLFRVWFSWEPNYFYIYNHKGTPLKFLYEACPTSVYGWFAINWLYTLTLFAVFVAVFIGLFCLAGWMVKKKTNSKVCKI